MAALPSLVVNLGLNSVDFISGLTKAQYEAQKASKEIVHGLESIKEGFETVIGLAGLGLGVHELVELGKAVIEDAEHLNNLAKSTGSTVEELSRLENVAKFSGESVDTLSATLLRLAAGLNGSEELSTKTANALRFLGVQSKDPATALQEVADKLNKFADGASKAALVRDLLGRSGPAQLAFFHDLATATEITSTKTREQAEQAENLAKAIRGLSIEFHTLADFVLNDVAPALEKVVGLFATAARESGGLLKGFGAVAGINPFGDVKKQAEETEQALARAREAVRTQDVNFLGGGSLQANQENVKYLERQLAIINQLVDKQKTAEEERVKRRQPDARPPLGYISAGNTASGAIDDPAKRLLEGQVKALDASIAAEKESLQHFETYQKEFFDQNAISIASYYSNIQGARAAALASTIKYYDEEIAAETRYRDTQAKTLADRQAAQNKIDEFRAKQSKAANDAVFENNVLAFAQQKTNTQYLAQLDEIKARLLEVQGAATAAAAVRFDAQNAGLNAQFRLNGNPEAVRQNDEIRARLLLQTELNEKTREFSLIQNGLAVEQGYVNLAQSTGAISEATALRASSELNKERLVQLQATADAYAKIAASPFATPEQILQAEQMKLAVAQLAAQTDLLADKFNKGFGDAFTSSFSDFITGTKTAKEAFTDFTKQITRQISDVAAQNISTALFGKGGVLSGAGGFLSDLFGGSGKAGGAGGTAAADAALTTVATTSTAVSGALTIMSSSALAASIALEAVALSSAAGAAGSVAQAAVGAGGIFESLTGLFAGGTDYAPGGLALVGERGPEIVNLPRGARVTPNDQIGRGSFSGRGGVTNITVNVPAGTSGPSADQIALRVGAATSRAIARNG